MPSLNVSDVLDDPDFLDTTLQVRRAVTTTGEGGLARTSFGWLPFAGVVIPDGGQDLIQTGDGDAVTGDITIYTRFALTTGDADAAADLIAWNGATFTAINAQPWLYGDGYTRAVCKLATLNPSQGGSTDDTGFLG